jgi:hypothetical protein
MVAAGGQRDHPRLFDAPEIAREPLKAVGEDRRVRADIAEVGALRDLSTMVRTENGASGIRAVRAGELALTGRSGTSALTVAIGGVSGPNMLTPRLSEDDRCC